jgi:hypothetical protein
MSAPTRHLIETATGKALRAFAVLFFLGAIFPALSALTSFIMLAIASSFILAGLLLLALALIVDATVTTAHESQRANEPRATMPAEPARASIDPRLPITVDELEAATEALKRARSA